MSLYSLLHLSVAYPDSHVTISILLIIHEDTLGIVIITFSSNQIDLDI